MDTQHGVALYDLARMFCEECGRHMSQRLFAMRTGCETCDAVITRHRCAGRPERSTMDTGEWWECPDCGSRWQAIEKAEPCGECGQDVWEDSWDYHAGDRVDTAPRYEPPGFTPFRNVFAGLHYKGDVDPPCYRTDSGSAVHFSVSCRCHR